MRTTHELKCWPEYMEIIREGRKTFEVRDNFDREFREGDRLILRAWEPGTKTYTNMPPLAATIGYVLPAGAWGIPLHKTVFSLIDVGEAQGD